MEKSKIFIWRPTKKKKKSPLLEYGQFFTSYDFSRYCQLVCGLLKFAYPHLSLAVANQIVAQAKSDPPDRALREFSTMAGRPQISEPDSIVVSGTNLNHSDVIKYCNITN